MNLDNIYITSDTHYYHGNIIKYCHRPFLCDEDKAELNRRGGRWHNGEFDTENPKWRIGDKSLKMMNDELINQTNKIVPANATLYHLGDYCGGTDYVKNCIECRERINCREMVIIWGNHDKHKNKISHLFSRSYSVYELEISKKIHFTFNHYAHLTWNHSHYGSINLYGHSHGQIEDWADHIMPDRRSMDVGVDNAARIVGAYRPFSLAEIVERFKDRKGFIAHRAMRNGIIGV